MEPVKDQINQGVVSGIGCLALIAFLGALAWWVASH